MPRFQYTAIGAGGKKTKGTVTAENAYAARKQLRMRSIHPTKVRELRGSGEQASSIFAKLKRSNKKELLDFTKQMATLLNSGIKLTEALSVMMIQTSDVRFRNILVDIRERVVTGESLTDAMRDYEDYFDVIYVAMIRVGEMTGSIQESFATIAAFKEKQARVEGKLVTAMIYPVVLTVFSLSAVVVISKFVIPKIGEQLIATGQELPITTKILLGMGWLFGDILRILVLVLIIAGIVVAIRTFFKTPRGALIRDKFALSVPLFGPLIRQRVVSRFASTLSTLLGSGMAMAESLRVVSEVTGNILMKTAIQQSRERILAGSDIATPLRDSGVISPAIAHMVAVGEKSGELEMMLKNISEDLEANTDVVIDRLSAAFEPIIIVLMAIMIGIIAHGTIVPLMNVSSVEF